LPASNLLSILALATRRPARFHPNPKPPLQFQTRNPGLSPPPRPAPPAAGRVRAIACGVAGHRRSIEWRLIGQNLIASAICLLSGLVLVPAFLWGPGILSNDSHILRRPGWDNNGTGRRIGGTSGPYRAKRSRRPVLAARKTLKSANRAAEAYRYGTVRLFNPRKRKLRRLIPMPVGGAARNLATEA
jgi:hypothetical protein